MGFSEDDRIRSKNKTSTMAWQMYDNLRSEGLDNRGIHDLVSDIAKSDKNNIRNEIYLMVLKIVGSNLDEKSNISSSDDSSST